MPGKSKSGGGLKSKKYVMQMGVHSEDSDTTFKEKDQANISSGPGSRLAGAMKKNNAQYGSVKTNGNKTTILTIRDNRKSSGPGINDLPKKSAPKTPSSPKPYVKKGGKATGSIKNYAIGSDARRKEYDARGWAYDNTIKRPKTTKSNASSIKSKPVSIASKPKAAALTSAPKTVTSTPKTKSSKIRAKGEAALASGNVKKAQRLRERYDRIEKRKNKKASIADAYKVNL